jgi:hypothetical protein
MGFGLVTLFIYRLYTELVITSNYNSLIGLHTLKITVTTAHVKYFVFIGRFLVTASNSGVSSAFELTPLWTGYRLTALLVAPTD